MKKTLVKSVVSLAVGAVLSGSVVAADNPKDPAEGFNRAMFAVNEGLDTAVAKPLAKGYDYVAPLPVKAVVGNFFSNIADVMIGVNNLLQGKPGQAFNDWGRVLVNTTVGIGGAFDVASEMGLDKHYEDFGQTMGSWGVDEGAYLFWPIIGPRTVRDTAGFVVDSYADPVWYVEPIAVRNSFVGLRYVDQRAALLPTDKIIEEGALDKYAYIRDAYLQHRRNAVYDGNPPRELEVPDGKAPVELKSSPEKPAGR
ncbi:VacJ family lipoprotein [Azospira restricta]|uniref:VacJ family lipoprotein n=1 Tax=Azospira restricta TaxID=404405 RepID=A0A974SNT7_9RHOO|nr:VacJ family lipoprotein [Azospira restricta]QRJ63692.1 VacJ family lipoprotein [Azospira restricta]